MPKSPPVPTAEANLRQARAAWLRTGDDRALVELVERMTPIVQARVARCLLRRMPSGPGRDVRQEVEDLVQETFVVLFADGGKVLEKWSPGQGLSLQNYVGMVAERRAISILRTGKRNPWKEDPTLTETLDRPSDASGPEELTASRDLLVKALERLQEELTPLGRRLFELLFLEERSVRDTCSTTGMTSDAVYAWRSRLRRLAGRIFDELASEAGAAPRIPVQ